MEAGKNRSLPPALVGSSGVLVRVKGPGMGWRRCESRYWGLCCCGIGVNVEAGATILSGRL